MVGQTLIIDAATGDRLDTLYLGVTIHKPLALLADPCSFSILYYILY